MSYARFSEGDVYVFTSSVGLECCGCFLEDREWVDDPDALFGGYLKNKGEEIQTVFQSNAEMIAHLEEHQKQGHYVPEFAFERLRDPEDEKQNQEIWAKYSE